MATEVLYPQDVLAQRLRPHPAASVYTHQRKPHPHPHYHTSNTSSTTNPSSTSSSCRSTNVSNPRPSRKAPALDQKRRREGSGSPPPSKAPQPQPHVTVLRRGESLDSALAGGSSRSSALPCKQGPPSTTGLVSSASGGDLITAAAAARSSSHPPPRGDIYAGSGFTVSPAPSALPLPTSFFSSAARKDDRSPPAFLAGVEVGPVDHSATKDLLRLLGLQ